MGLQQAVAKIANGQSDSEALNLYDQVICGLFVPAGFAGTQVTFQVSPTDVDPNAVGSGAAIWYPVYDASGTELIVTVAASRFVAISPVSTRGFKFLKIRNGLGGAPVNVGADTLIVLSLDNHGGS